MSKQSAIVFVCLVAAMAMGGCARYKFVKNPDDCNTGLRYYRPKPYLFVGSTVVGEKADAKAAAVIRLEYLPDYEEEYAVEIYPGLGANDLQISLENGWNLTSFHGKTEQQYDKILTALAGVTKAAAAPSGGGPPCESVVDTPRPVPQGYYESVFWTDNNGNGKKHLFGWRYVGFLPFSACPVNACPSMRDVYCDDPSQFWAIVPNGSSLAFVRMDDLRKGTFKALNSAPPPTDAPPAPSSASDDEGEDGAAHFGIGEQPRLSRKLAAKSHLVGPATPVRDYNAGRE